MEINDAATNAYPNLESLYFEIFMSEETILRALRQAFKEGAEWQKRQSPWINVNERLPDEVVGWIHIPNSN